jgi:hypothetical protein
MHNNMLVVLSLVAFVAMTLMVSTYSIHAADATKPIREKKAGLTTRLSAKQR